MSINETNLPWHDEQCALDFPTFKQSLSQTPLSGSSTGSFWLNEIDSILAVWNQSTFLRRWILSPKHLWYWHFTALCSINSVSTHSFMPSSSDFRLSNTFDKKLRVWIWLLSRRLETLSIYPSPLILFNAV